MISFGSAAVAAQPSSTENLKKALKKKIEAHRQSSFEPLTQKIENQYGTTAVLPLIQIAKEKKYSERYRYMALMASAKIGGKEAAKLLSPLLSDASWVIRSGALRALRTTDETEVSKQSLALLNDKALVVRLEAIDTITRLKPAGWQKALIQVIERPENYSRGRALWVPNRAVKALRENQDLTFARSDIIPKLQPLLDRSNDSALLEDTMITLEALSQSPTPRNLTQAQRIQYWRNTKFD